MIQQHRTSTKLILLLIGSVFHLLSLSSSLYAASTISESEKKLIESEKELFDFEKKLIDDFVLETRKIDIPNYPDAFNPSIIRWKGSLLMSFRSGRFASEFASEPEDGGTLVLSFRTRDPLNGCTNGIGLALLDDDFNLIGIPQILEIPHENPLFMFRQQDPRLIAVGDKVYIVYSNMIDGVSIPETRRMFVAELKHDKTQFYTTAPEALIHFEGENEHRWQKNWVPFDYKGKLMLAYSINPHKIVCPRLDGSGICDTVSQTEIQSHWQLLWGHLRGGTQALPLNDHEYISFFHSSKERRSIYSPKQRISHYVMGAYTFSNKPPFNITAISHKPIVGDNFYNGPAYKTWKPLRVVFPCGFIMDTDFIWVVYGRQDHEIWVAKIYKKEFLGSLVPVQQ